MYVFVLSVPKYGNTSRVLMATDIHFRPLLDLQVSWIVAKRVGWPEGSSVDLADLKVKLQKVGVSINSMHYCYDYPNVVNKLCELSTPEMVG